MNKRKIIYLCLGILTIGILVASRFVSDAQTNEDAAVTTVKIDQAKISSDCDTREFSGFVRGENQADIAPKVSGRIIKINKNEGETVKKGEIVAVIDSATAAVDAKGATQGVIATEKIQQETKNYYDKLVKEAKTARDQAKDDGKDAYETANRAYKSAVAARDLQVSVAESQRVAAQNSLNSAKTQLSDFAITAPFDGIIIRRYLQEGDFAGPGSFIFSMASGDKLELNSSLSLSDAKGLNIGDKVDLSGENYKGRGEIIALSSAGDPLSQRMEARIAIENNDHIGIGDFLRADLSVAGENFLTVSRAAVFHHYDDAFVFVAKDNIAKERKVILDRDCQDRIAIKQGINDADYLIIDGRENLRDGDHIIYEK